MDPYYSPLRYPGGKGKVLNYVRLLFHHNRLVGRDYIEPYAGGAAVALGLLFHDYVGKIWINDIDAAIYAFWYSILNHSDEFVENIRSVELTIDEWYRQRTILLDSKSDVRELGFACFFLNRTNRSGILRGGVIGGKDQSGPYKLDARFDREKLISRILKIASRRNRIRLTCLDTAQLLTQVDGWSNRSPFIYLDPPYVDKGAELYLNHYKESDHREIANLISNLQVPWLVSYDDIPLVREVYSQHRALYYSLQYSAQERKKGGEAMFFSPDLSIPKINSPAGLTAREVWKHEQLRLAL